MYDLYCSPNIWVIKFGITKGVGHFAVMGHGNIPHRVLVKRSERKRPLGKPKRRCDDKNKGELLEVG
jgi:hypothetical protein